MLFAQARRTGASALTLLVARVGADHAHHALAADDLAVAAHLLDGRGDFHLFLLELIAATRASLTSRGTRCAPGSGRKGSVRPSPCRPAGCGCSACASFRRCD